MLHLKVVKPGLFEKIIRRYQEGESVVLSAHDGGWLYAIVSTY